MNRSVPFLLGAALLVFLGCDSGPGVKNFIAVPLKETVFLTWFDPPREEAGDLSHIEISFSPETGTAQPLIVPLGRQEVLIEGLRSGVDYSFSARTVDVKGRRGGRVRPLVHDVYIAGYLTSERWRPQAVCWKNGVPQSLGRGSRASALGVSGGEVYVAGCDEGGLPAIWHRGRWKGLDLPRSVKGGFVCALVLSAGDVYAAGELLSASWTAFPCYWKNGERFALAHPLGDMAGAYALALGGDNLYAAGLRRPRRESPGAPRLWKNGELVEIPGFVSGALYCAAAAGDDVYAGGALYTEELTRAVYVKNGELVTLSGDRRNALVMALTLSGSHVYAGGRDGMAAVYWRDDEEVVLSTVPVGSPLGSGGIVRGIAVVTEDAVSGPLVLAVGEDQKDGGCTARLWACGRVFPLDESGRYSSATAITVAPRS
ncbi:MAG: fibronectin type III domain-containing protein [Treponema sp.]|jgi:hypothetical protein|nr:fibronectin type III domain-containing protein [Treponema sp.]